LNSEAAAGDYSVSIDWGDGTAADTTPGSVEDISSDGGVSLWRNCEPKNMLRQGRINLA
jgi:hypothetical protein